jgi:hypothetical protein
MKKSLFTKQRAPAKARPKKRKEPILPIEPMVSQMEPIEPVNAPLYPSVEDLYPHLREQIGVDSENAHPEEMTAIQTQTYPMDQAAMDALRARPVPPVEDLYPHLNLEPVRPARHMPPVTKWP